MYVCVYICAFGLHSLFKAVKMSFFGTMLLVIRPVQLSNRWNVICTGLFYVHIQRFTTAYMSKHLTQVFVFLNTNAIKTIKKKELPVAVDCIPMQLLTSIFTDDSYTHNI